MTYEMKKQKPSLDLSAIIILVVLCASWGLQQVTIKIVNHGISPTLQAGIRSIGATILIWIWMIIRREPLFEKDGTLWWGISAGFLFSIEFLLIYWGLDYTNASRAVIFIYISPFIVALGAQLFIPGEHLRIIQISGLCCAFTGIIIAFSESLTLPTHHMLIGDSMLIVAGILWGATTVLIKASPLVNIKPSKTLIYQLSVSAIILPASSLALGEPGIMSMTPLIVGCLLYQILWVAFITYLAWFWLLRTYPASRVASFTFLTPIFGVLAGAMLLKEPITISLLMALLLVGIGIYLVNRPATE